MNCAIPLTSLFMVSTNITVNAALNVTARVHIKQLLYVITISLSNNQSITITEKCPLRNVTAIFNIV